MLGDARHDLIGVGTAAAPGDLLAASADHRAAHRFSPSDRCARSGDTPGAALIAAVAADAEQQTARHRGKKSRVAAKKPDAAAEPKNEAKSEAKDTGGAAKPARLRHANAKPDATPKAADKSDAKPAKPKAAAKPATKPKSTEVEPADQKSAAAPHT